MSLENYLNKYYCNEDFTSNFGVKTIIDDAFGKLGLEGIEKEIIKGDFDTKFKKVQEDLLPSSKGAPKGQKLDYFDWLDFSQEGVLYSNFQETKAMADQVKQEAFDGAFVMGMGGSSMNAKFINSVFPGGTFKMDVMDNMDPGTLRVKLDKLNQDSSKLLYIFISKSGNTFEVKHVINAVIDYISSKKFAGDSKQALEFFAKHSLFVSEAPENQYRADSSKIGMLNELVRELEQKTSIKPKFISHPPRVGGRYSLFSVVGMLISELKGLNSEQFLAGAKKCTEEFFKAASINDCNAAKYALLDTLLARNSSMVARYIMTYSDDLRLLPELTSQLSGESNNKDDIDSLNQVSGRGPTAHHSDVEALCKTANRRLLFEEVLIRDNEEDIIHQDTGLDILSDLKGKSMHQEALTELALPFARHLSHRKGNPVISTILDKKTEFNIAYLAMRYMLATIIQAGLQEQLQTSVLQAEVEYMKKNRGQDKVELGLDKEHLAA